LTAPPGRRAAVAVVVVDVVAEGSQGAKRTLTTYLRIDLVNDAARWKVDRVVNLNVGQNRAVPATTTTSGPASSTASTTLLPASSVPSG
jgi:hypothetical protein